VYPLARVGLEILKMIPLMMISPRTAPIFWLVVVLVLVQYRRIARVEASLYGTVKNDAVRQTGKALGYGLLGGVVGSFIMVGVGVTLSGSGVVFLLPVALFLMLLSPRLLCFSYAGGILAVSTLLFGVPEVDVAGLMGLVAALHLVESLLIYIGGAGCATPLFVRHGRGGVVGAFALQRFWPVPIAVLVLLGAAPGEAIAMPDWWPLIRAQVEAAPDAMLVYSLLPVTAALGYGDIAISAPPEVKSKETSVYLALYGAVLMGLAVLASHFPPLRWAAALFGPLGHEAVIRRGNAGQRLGAPRYVHPQRGVMLLDVLPGGAADECGLRRGDVLLSVGGRPVTSREDVPALLADAPRGTTVVVEREGARTPLQVRCAPAEGGRWGMIFVPGPDEKVHVELGRPGPLGRFILRVLGRG